MKRSSWILWGLLSLMACSKTTVHGITPISPTAGFSYWTYPLLSSVPAVESLQSTFRWKPVGDSNARYDFVIFESYGRGAVLGEKVYYRKGLQEPEHTLEISLQPDRQYYWSVRVRRGEEVSDWSRFDYSHRVGCGSSYESFAFFRFRTPDE